MFHLHFLVTIALTAVATIVGVAIAVLIDRRQEKARVARWRARLAEQQRHTEDR